MAPDKIKVVVVGSRLSAEALHAVLIGALAHQGEPVELSPCSDVDDATAIGAGVAPGVVVVADLSDEAGRAIAAITLYGSGRLVAVGNTPERTLWEQRGIPVLAEHDLDDLPRAVLSKICDGGPLVWARAGSGGSPEGS